MTKIRIVARSNRDILGEGPIWSPRQNAVLWVDIVGQWIHRLSLATESVASWNVSEPIGWIIERRNRDGYLAGLKSGFAFLWLDPLRTEKIGCPEPDRPWNRLNDAKADVFGCVWAGSMDEGQHQASGGLYRINTELRWERVDDGYSVTNGPAFSPDNRTMYHADTAKRVIYAFDLSKNGNPLRRRLWVRFQDGWGFPDGMTADVQSGIWVAHWGGGRISRFFPDGSLDRSIRMPATNITSIVFAGDDLRRMFVTSASLESETEPAAGALFEVEAGAQGLPAQPFGA